jgi:hypothetical protein
MEEEKKDTMNIQGLNDNQTWVFQSGGQVFLQAC